MGLLDRWREPPPEAWRPPLPGSCSCERHVENMLTVSIPHAAGVPSGGPAPTPESASAEVTVAALVDRQAMAVRPAGPDETYVDLPPTGQRTGPYHWVLELDAGMRLLYDDAAPVQLDDCLAAQPAVERVAWLDRDRFAVGAPGLCPSGLRATLVTALTNPRVRRA